MKFVEFLKLASKPRKRKNKALLLATAKRLRNLKHEEHYDQSMYVDQTQCGTACCIAGWAVIQAGCSMPNLTKLEYAEFGSDIPDIPTAARTLLGLPADQARILFTGAPTMRWPEPYATRYADARQGRSKERPSRVAADFLEAIAEGKVKL